MNNRESVIEVNTPSEKNTTQKNNYFVNRKSMILFLTISKIKIEN